MQLAVRLNISEVLKTIQVDAKAPRRSASAAIVRESAEEYALQLRLDSMHSNGVTVDMQDAEAVVGESGVDLHCSVPNGLGSILKTIIIRLNDPEEADKKKDVKLDDLKEAGKVKDVKLDHLAQ